MDQLDFGSMCTYADIFSSFVSISDIFASPLLGFLHHKTKNRDPISSICGPFQSSQGFREPSVPFDDMTGRESTGKKIHSILTCGISPFPQILNLFRGWSLWTGKFLPSSPYVREYGSVPPKITFDHSSYTSCCSSADNTDSVRTCISAAVSGCGVSATMTTLRRLTDAQTKLRKYCGPGRQPLAG